MNSALIILVVFVSFMVLWFIGLAVYGYHVFAYGLPGDRTKFSFYILLTSAMIALIVVAYALSGLNWGAV